jgi:4-hydroxy-tetrahydrodipicolinate reductase
MAETPARLVISGAGGRMGRTVARLASADTGFRPIGGIDRYPGPGPEGLPAVVAVGEAESLLRSADVVVDFSAPPLLHALLEKHTSTLEGRSLIVGTTGLGAAEERLLAAAAERLAVLSAANFSVGVNLLLAVVARAAASLGPEFEIEIVEAHHRRKEDAPSGTALALGEAVAAARGIDLAEARRDGRSGRPGSRSAAEIGFHALRGGEIVGDHHVHFIGDLERLELTHRASDRSVFAAGALRAARWLAGRPAGRYSMGDVLGL